MNIDKVAPLVGAWIEISSISTRQIPSLSLPSWERGLKSDVVSCVDIRDVSRSPRGSVD